MEEVKPEAEATGEVVQQLDAEESCALSSQALVVLYSRLVARRPLTVCLLVTCIVICFTAIPLVVFADDLVELDFGLSSMQVRGNDISDKTLTMAAVQRYLKDGRKSIKSSEEKAKRPVEVTLVYGSKDGGNLLTESRLQQALALERKVTEVLGEPHHTPMQLMFPSYPDSSLAGVDFQEVLAMTAEHVLDTRNMPTKWPSFEQTFSACTPSSRIVASSFLTTSRDSNDATFDGIAALETEEVYIAFFWDAFSWGGETTYFGRQRSSQIAKDVLLIIGVLISCIVIVGLQTRSAFIALMGLLAILLATGTAFTLYRIFMTKWFGILNGFSVFLLLGIATDDIFIVSDLWRHATEVQRIPAEDCETRMRFMLPRAMSAISATSLTTAGALFGNAISNIPPLRLFGIFAGMMVLADWLITIALLPSILVLQQRWFGHVTFGTLCTGHVAGSPRALEKVLTQQVAPRLFKVAPCVVVAFAVLAALALNVALEIPPGAEFHESDLFPPHHLQHRSRVAMNMMVDLEPEYVQAFIYYGVKPVDTGSGMNPKAKTEIQIENDFDIYAPGVQEFTAELCSDLLTQRGIVRSVWMCWAHSVQDHLRRKGEVFPAADLHSLEDVMSSSGVHSWGDSGKIVEIVFETNVLSKATVAELRVMYDKFEAFMEKWNAEATRRGLHGLSKGFHASHAWRFMSTIENMATTCVAACCTSMAIVLVVLLLTMQNVVVVLLIVLHVIAICLTGMAIFVLQGRKLGVLESIAATLLVGLSVDYLVHIGSCYLDEQEEKQRGRRVLKAVAHIGGSVIASSLTTVISALFLCGATISFFGAFGIFIVIMISLSMIFTMMSLTSALYVFGPEHNVGSIRCCCRRRVMNYVSSAESETKVGNDVLTMQVELPVVSLRVQRATAFIAGTILVAGSATRLGLSLSEKAVSQEECPAYTEIDFTFEQHPIAAEQDSYRCRDFQKLPSGCTYYATEWEPIISDGMEGIVHHMILFSVETVKSECSYTCFDMPNALGQDAAWAVGSGAFKLPDGMAYALSGSRHALQMHYYNPLLASSLVDVRSGVKMKVTKTPPARATLTSLLIGLHPLGALMIEPGRQNTTLYVECAPRLRGPVTVLAFAPHAHKIANSIHTEVLRPKLLADGTLGGPVRVGDVGSDRNYLFDFQQIFSFAPGQERILEPGDIVQVFCSYRSMDRSFTTRSGWGSEDEMCMTVLYAYPAENVTCKRSDSDAMFPLIWTYSCRRLFLYLYGKGLHHRTQVVTLELKRNGVLT